MYACAVRRLGERERAVDGHGDPARRAPSAERRSDLVRRRHPEAEDAVAVAEELDDVERDDLAGVRAAGDEAAVRRHRRQVLGEAGAAGGVDDDVDTAAARGLGDGLGDGRLEVAEHDIGAEAQHRVGLLGRADRGDHAGAGDHRRLHSGAGHTARCRGHEHGLAGSHGGDARHHRPRRRSDALGGGGGDELVLALERDHRAGRDDRELGVAAPAVGAEDDESLAQVLAPAGACRASCRTRTAGRPSPGRRARCPRRRRRRGDHGPRTRRRAPTAW